jgi:hypothetical protein
MIEKRPLKGVRGVLGERLQARFTAVRAVRLER